MANICYTIHTCFHADLLIKGIDISNFILISHHSLDFYLYFFGNFGKKKGSLNIPLFHQTNLTCNDRDAT